MREVDWCRLDCVIGNRVMSLVGLDGELLVFIKLRALVGLACSYGSFNVEVEMSGKGRQGASSRLEQLHAGKGISVESK